MLYGSEFLNLANLTKCSQPRLTAAIKRVCSKDSLMPPLHQKSSFVDCNIFMDEGASHLRLSQSEERICVGTKTSRAPARGAPNS